MTKKMKEEATEAEIKAAKKTANEVTELIGTKYLTLNNAKQDPAFVRQPLGYRIFKQCGVPYPLCNFARVIIDTGTEQTFNQVYVNLEQMQKPQVKRNFSGNTKGNLYETEMDFDLTENHTSLGWDQEGFSPFEDQKDLKVAIPLISQKLGGAKPVIAVKQITRVIAIHTLVKHWDGYPNNTFVYNDTEAVENPKPEDLNLKLIPSGIDQILQPDQRFLLKNDGVLQRLIVNDKDAYKNLKEALGNCRKTFKDKLDDNQKFIDEMARMLEREGAKNLTNTDVADEIKIVKHEMDAVNDCVQNMLDKWDSGRGE